MGSLLALEVTRCLEYVHNFKPARYISLCGITYDAIFHWTHLRPDFTPTMDQAQEIFEEYYRVNFKTFPEALWSKVSKIPSYFPVFLKDAEQAYSWVYHTTMSTAEKQIVHCPFTQIVGDADIGSVGDFYREVVDGPHERLVYRGDHFFPLAQGNQVTKSLAIDVSRVILRGLHIFK